MRGQIFFVLMLVIYVESIKVPVNDNQEESSEDAPVTSAEQSQAVPTYYPPDTANLDSYLVPPDPHNPEEVIPDVIATPATFLLPPSPEKQTDYYYTPTTAAEQTDWYPIAQIAQANVAEHLLPQQQADVIPIIIDNQSQLSVHRGAKVLQPERITVPTPSTKLLPPLENAPNDYVIAIPSEDFELPVEDIRRPFNLSPDFPRNQESRPIITEEVPVNIRLNPSDPTISLQLTPPRVAPTKFKYPTKVYPKKYGGGFKPVPIPIGEYLEDQKINDLRGKVVKPQQPGNAEIEYLTPSDEKQRYLYEQAEQKRRLKGQEELSEQDLVQEDESYEEPVPTEQETSATNFRHLGRNVYPAPLRQAPPPTPSSDVRVPPPGDRTEFRMHGMKGPHSYQFGYDTGKGKNRQFRYEERDNDGHVKGHYGYVDKLGKLRVVNYDAHPEHGFRASPVIEEKS